MAFLLLLLLFRVQPWQPQNPDSLVITQWTIRDGLPLNTTTRVAQDKDGFLWITTYDGLVRFDGRRFVTYSHAEEPAIRNNRLGFLNNTEDGSLWISLESQGIVRYKDNTFRHYGSESGLTMEHITVMVSVPGGMWVGSFDGLYRYRLDSDRFARIDLGEDPEANNIHQIEVDADGSAWVTTHDGVFHIRGQVVRRLDRGRYVAALRDSDDRIWLAKETGLRVAKRDGTLAMPDGLPPWVLKTNIHSMARYRDGFLLGTHTGIFRLRGNRITPLRMPDRMQIQEIIQIFTDSRGNDWLVTNQGDMLQIRGDAAIRVPILQPLEDAVVIQVFEDVERNLWVTTTGGGLFRIKPNHITHLGVPEGLAGNNILSLMFDRHGRFIVGTRSDGLSIVSASGIQNLELPGITARGIVQDTHEDRAGRIWVATFQNGLYRLTEADRLVRVGLGNSVLTNDVRAIHEAADGTLWLGSTGGLMRFNPNTLRHVLYNRDSGLPSQVIRHITPDSAGRLWLATNDAGVYRFDTQSGDIVHHHVGTGMPSNITRTVFIDPDDPDVLWVGSETHGLIRIKEGRYAFADRRSGLPDHIVHAIRQDPYQWLWISTNRGIVRIEKSSLNAFLDGKQSGFHFTVFDEADGIRNAEANGSIQDPMLVSPDGRILLVATQNGVAMIPIREPDARSVPPAVFFQDGTAYLPVINLRLDGYTRSVRIPFLGLNYSSPFRIRFQYRILGRSDEWQDIYHGHTLHLKDLPFGETRVELIAWNEAGTLSSDPALARILVVPWFWQTAWFWSVVVVLFAGGVWALVHYRTSKLELLRLRLEAMVRDKTLALQREKDEVEHKNAIIEEQSRVLEELNQTKDRFFSIIGHDLRGPFQSLIGLTQLVIEEYEVMDDAEIQQNLRHLKQSSETLHRLVENLLEWSALQKGKVKLLIEDVDMNHIAQSTIRMFGPSASVKGIHLEALIPDGFRVKADRNIVETVIRNLVSNAIKYTRAEGVVVLEAGIDDTGWWIQVSDNGIGMSEKLRAQLMKIDRGVKRRGTTNESGTGLGLVLCKELMTLHKGSIRVESEEDVGSRFTARFPFYS